MPFESRSPSSAASEPAAQTERPDVANAVALAAFAPDPLRGEPAAGSAAGLARVRHESGSHAARRPSQ